MKYFDTIIVGAGPCGLMCSYHLKNQTVLLIDANNEIGGKIKVSGGGRCNITNNKPIPNFLENIPKNNKFLFSTFNNYSPQNIITFFKENNLDLKEEDNNRIFPVSNKSDDFIRFFEEHINLDENKFVKLNYIVENIVKDSELYIVDGKFSCKNLVISTGGASYENISHGYKGYELLQELNHTITDIKPAESSLVITSPLIESRVIQGISLKNVRGVLYINGKKKMTLNKDLLFTHFGLSGPLAFNYSYFIKEALDKGKKCEIKLFVNEPPKRLISHLEDGEMLLQINDVKGLKTAFVTNGGIKLKEVNPKNLESKINNNLYIGGEVLDINCFTGGYNIGTCLCEGKLISDSINMKMESGV